MCWGWFDCGAASCGGGVNEGAVRAKLSEGGGGGPEVRPFAGPESPGGGGGGGGAESAFMFPEGRWETGGGAFDRTGGGGREAAPAGIDPGPFAEAGSTPCAGGGFVCFVSSALSLSKTWVASFSSSQSISMPPGLVFGAYGAGRVEAGAGALETAPALPAFAAFAAFRGGAETAGRDPRPAGGAFEACAAR